MLQTVDALVQQKAVAAGAPRDREAGEAAEETYYTPEQVDYWVRNWLLLETLAETPRSSRHHLTWEHKNRRGACDEDPHLEQRTGVYHGDPMLYCDIEADISRAWCCLKDEPRVPLAKSGPGARILTGTSGRWSLAFRLVKFRMKGRTLRQIEDELNLRHGSTDAIYWAAMRHMAKTLGWDEGE